MLRRRAALLGMVLGLAVCAVATAAPLDEARLRDAGLRAVVGRHLTLITDLPAGQEIDGLPTVFDAAVPQWQAYFGLDAEALRDWRVTGYLIGAAPRFQAAELLPDTLPNFVNGYALGREVWLNEQPNDYYRRHLLLHEGTHALMGTLLGGVGPPWLAEGLAELLATHRWDPATRQLTLGYFPRSRDETPLLGRIKIVRDGVAAGRAMTVDDVLNLGPGAHFSNEPYGWCWALAALLDGTPRYRERFRALPRHVREPDLNRRVRDDFAPDWLELADDWHVFIANLQHGHDLARTTIEFAPGEALPAAGGHARVVADRGWQSAKLRVEAGHTYQVRATGRFQIAAEPKPWPCEAGGVSIRYYAGQPLGTLLAVVRPDDRPPGAPSPFARPEAIGLAAELSPRASGVLYLMLNDSPAERGDNSGAVAVTINE